MPLMYSDKQWCSSFRIIKSLLLLTYLLTYLPSRPTFRPQPTTTRTTVIVTMARVFQTVCFAWRPAPAAKRHSTKYHSAQVERACAAGNGVQYRAASQRELHYRNDCGGSATRGPARDGMRAGWDDLEAKRPRQKRSDDVWRDRPVVIAHTPCHVTLLSGHVRLSVRR